MFRFASRIAPVEKQVLRFKTNDPFFRFLGEVAGASAPNFAMLAGNPNTPGQRGIFLVFNENGTPAAVVKAGAGDVAAALIAHEREFLQSASKAVPGIPRVRACFTEDRIAAFAIDFFPGDSPNAHDFLNAHKVLTSWINPDDQVRICDLSVWKRLLSGAGASLSPMARELGGRSICTAIYHGDFAPWNIRVHRGNWTILDWERGESRGMPLWDLLHFVIQPAILVEHAPPIKIVSRLSFLLNKEMFADYKKRVNITEVVLPLAMAYLNYCLHVTRQSEGVESIKELLQILDRFHVTPGRAFMSEFGLR
jgi:hypothetical protein